MTGIGQIAPGRPTEIVARRAVEIAPCLAIVTITVAAVALRMYQLARESLWLDEAGRVAIAQLPWDQIPGGVAAIELSPPLYHFVLAAWMRLFGGTDFAVRALSALLVVLAIPLAWSLGRAVGGTVVGLLLAVLVAASPFALHYGQEAAMYALLLPLAIATLRSAIGVLEGNRAPRARWLAAYVVCGTLALSTHYYAGLLLATTALVGMAHSAQRRAWHGVGAWVGATLVIALAFLPWLPTLLAQARLAASVEDWGGVTPFGAAMQWAVTLLADGAPAVQGGAALGLAFAGVALGAWRLRARPVIALLLVALVLLPLGAAILAAGPLHAFRARGFIAVVPALWLLLAVALVPSRADPPWVRMFSPALGLALLAVTTIGLGHHWQERKEDWRGAAALVRAHAGPGDPIFFVHFGGQIAFDRYFAGPQPRLGLPDSFTWNEGYRAPYQVSEADVQRRLPMALAGTRRAWLVLSHDAGRGSDLVVRELERWSGGPPDFDVPVLGVRVLRFSLPAPVA